MVDVRAGTTGLLAQLAVADGVVGALPRKLRGTVEAQHRVEGRIRLENALTAWVVGARLSSDAFAGRFFGRAANDPAARALHGEAHLIASDGTPGTLREAAERVADAIQTGVWIGGRGSWPTWNGMSIRLRRWIPKGRNQCRLWMMREGSSSTGLANR